MKIRYNSAIFLSNFKSIILDNYGIDASMAKYTIIPVYDPNKTETGEDGAFRMIILSEDNIGDKTLSFEETFSILTAFEPHYPTKIEVSKVNRYDHPFMIEVKCSTRVRKPSAIANIDSKYAPFSVANT